MEKLVISCLFENSCLNQLKIFWKLNFLPKMCKWGSYAMAAARLQKVHDTGNQSRVWKVKPPIKFYCINLCGNQKGYSNLTVYFLLCISEPIHLLFHSFPIIQACFISLEEEGMNKADAFSYFRERQISHLFHRRLSRFFFWKLPTREMSASLLFLLLTTYPLQIQNAFLSTYFPLRCSKVWICNQCQ